MNQLDPRGAALYAIIGLSLVLAGGIMVASGVAIEQRASGITAIIAALALVAYRARRRGGGGDDAL